MKAPYRKFKEENKTKIIYKKLFCHSFIFGEDIDDKGIFLYFVIKNNKKILLNPSPMSIECEKSIRDHFENIKKEYNGAYLDMNGRTTVQNIEGNTIDIYFEAY